MIFSANFSKFSLHIYLAVEYYGDFFIFVAFEVHSVMVEDDEQPVENVMIDDGYMRTDDSIELKGQAIKSIANGEDSYNHVYILFSYIFANPFVDTI